MEFLEKIVKKSGLLMLVLFPVLSFASVYQYDPASRLVSLQAIYPGGVASLYSFCTDRLSQKINYLKNLGITFSDSDLKSETYRFLGSCIYGQSDFQASLCGVGYSALSCQPVTLPLDLPTLQRLSSPPASSSTPPASVASSFY